MNNKEMIDNLVRDGYLKTPDIINAFYKIDRKDFVLPKYQDYAYENHPLSIGYHQTISQPATVAFLLELLQPLKGQKILDIGSGSGWQTTLLAHIVGKNGKVFGIERISELVKFSKNNIKKYSIKKRIQLICRDGSIGLLEEKPFDRIIGAAEFPGVPENLRDQLKEDGRMVLPIKHSIFLITKIEEKEFPGFVFVPLIKNN